MEQAVKDRVSQGRIPQRLMPMLHGELAGDDGRAAPVSVFQEFEHIVSIFVIESCQPPPASPTAIGL